jgi:biotin carboxyl carrier protein
MNLNKKLSSSLEAGGAIGSAATHQFTSFGANVVAVDIDDTSITDAFADNDSVLPVQSDVTGTVKSFLVENGDNVTAGQVLAEITT